MNKANTVLERATNTECQMHRNCRIRHRRDFSLRALTYYQSKLCIKEYKKSKSLQLAGKYVKFQSQTFFVCLCLIFKFIKSKKVFEK